MNTVTKNRLKSVGITLFLLLVINIIGSFFFFRLDLTKDKRYTLSSTSLHIIEQVKNPLYIKVYMQGELPTEFKRLQLETRQMLEEFQGYNSNIIFEFIILIISSYLHQASLMIDH